MTRKEIATWLKTNGWKRTKKDGVTAFSDNNGNSVTIISNAQVVYYQNAESRFNTAFPLANVYVDPESSTLFLVYLNRGSYIGLKPCKGDKS